MKLFNNSTLNDIGQKVGSAAQTVGAAAQTGVSRSKQMAAITKLKMDNVSQEDAMKKAYTEIGKLYYAEHGDAPEGPYVALCSSISKAQDAIDANLAKINALKEGVSEETAAAADYAEPAAAAEAAPVMEEEAPISPDESAASEEKIPDEE